MIAFLADENISPESADYLEALGYPCYTDCVCFGQRPSPGRKRPGSSCEALRAVFSPRGGLCRLSLTVYCRARNGLNEHSWYYSLRREGPWRLSDAEIVDIARREGRIILTHDLDFGEIEYNADGLPKNGKGTT